MIKADPQEIGTAAQPEIHDIKVSIAAPERSYNVLIGSGLLGDFCRYLPMDIKGRRVFVVTDSHVAGLYAARVAEQIKGAGAGAVETLVLPPGEQSKSFAGLERILSWLMESGLNRQAVVVAVGGGVVGDIAGLAAALAMRGVACVQAPTTLLAQADSAIGGKTAIDMPQGKNLIGAFHQPAAVLCDIDTLKTLPDRQLKNGYAEVLKYGLIDDREFFFWLESNGEKVLSGDPAAQIRAVELSCRKKAQIVEADEKEAGQRALLNFGHTFGHALEQAAGYDERLLHGEAVAIGMVMALHLSARLGVLEGGERDRAIAHIKAAGLPVTIRDVASALEGISAETLLLAMQKDKKATDAGLRFILLHAIGKAYIADYVPPEDVRAVIQNSIEGK